MCLLLVLQCSYMWLVACSVADNFFKKQLDSSSTFIYRSKLQHTASEPEALKDADGKTSVQLMPCWTSSMRK